MVSQHGYPVVPRLAVVVHPQRAAVGRTNVEGAPWGRHAAQPIRTDDCPTAVVVLLVLDRRAQRPVEVGPQVLDVLDADGQT
jgi:hypothetical protein